MKPDFQSQVILIFSKVLQAEGHDDNFTFDIVTNSKGEVTIVVLKDCSQFGKILASYEVK